MIRTRLIQGIEKHASDLSPLLLVAAMLLIVTLPILKANKNTVVEGAIGAGHIQLVVTPTHTRQYDTRVSQSHRIVHGRRSLGSEAVAVYVNASAEPSVVLANLVIAVLQKRENMACDTHFYFVEDDTHEWPVPSSFVRAAMVINVSSLNVRRLCFNVYGSKGMQPNQDLFNLAMSVAKRRHLEVDVLCQNPHTVYSASRPRYEHYIRAMQTALVAPQEPRAWHTFRSRGISLLAISAGESDDSNGNASAHAIAALHEEVIARLSYLDQRLFRATSVWIPLSVEEYVEYDIIQFGIILLILSLVCTGYSIYKVEGLSLSPSVVLMWAASSIVLGGTESLGVAGFLFCSAAVAVAWSLCDWSLSWLAVNAVALCFIVLQPAACLLIGSGIAIQLIFLHVKCRRFPLLLLGTVVSWAVLYTLLVLLQVQSNVGTTGGIYLSFFAYPSTLWVSSRLIRFVLWGNA